MSGSISASARVTPSGQICTAYPAVYAVQFTARSNFQNDNGCGFEDAYAGWTGVDGQIATPSSMPPLDHTQDHNVGWIGAYTFGATSDTWIQIGWYTGLISDGACHPGPCTIDRLQTYGMYVEWHRASDGAYSVKDLGGLTLGQKVTYRVEYTPANGSGCWTAWYNYNTVAATACGLPNSAPMWAINELQTPSLTGQMASSEFGTVAGGTNQTLRLKGSQGYQDWNQHLLADGTGHIDIRNQPPGQNYVVSAVKLWWDIKTYQN